MFALPGCRQMRVNTLLCDTSGLAEKKGFALGKLRRFARIASANLFVRIGPSKVLLRLPLFYRYFGCFGVSKDRPNSSVRLSFPTPKIAFSGSRRHYVLHAALCSSALIGPKQTIRENKIQFSSLIFHWIWFLFSQTFWAFYGKKTPSCQKLQNSWRGHLCRSSR